MGRMKDLDIERQNSMADTTGFYKSSKWESKRKKILNRDEYLCQECKRYGRTTAATTVHHIYPLEQRPDLKLDSRNLISFCGKCHDSMHDRVSNVLTARGMEWVNRIAPLVEEK